MDCLVVGCGLSGVTIARALAEKGLKVQIIERREHIGGNLYDYHSEDGILLQKYGPHAFFTNDVGIQHYIERFGPVREFCADCATMINGRPYPMPFNFRAIDLLYEPEKAEKLKARLKAAFPGQDIVSVAELVRHSDALISEYGRFMYENEYKLYTAKQWGRPIESISPAVFERVPVYLSYRVGYQAHPYQFLPVAGFTDMIQKMLEHPNLRCELQVDALKFLTLDQENGEIGWAGEKLGCPVVYTGALDELFEYRYGQLPYRSLEFIWKKIPAKSAQETALVAWPQESTVTRTTEYTKFPPQDLPGKEETVIAIEIPFEYDRDRPFGNEPYYPVANEQTQELYALYKREADRLPNLFPAGRLADYKYYNMDHAIRRAWNVADEILRRSLD